MSFYKNLSPQAKLMIAEAIATSVAGLIHAGLGLSLTFGFVGLNLRRDRITHPSKPTKQQLTQSSPSPAQRSVCPLLILLYPIEEANPDSSDRSDSVDPNHYPQ